MPRTRARWLLWLPVLIVGLWIAWWIAREEYQHMLRQQSMRGQSVILREGSLAAFLISPEFFRASPRVESQAPGRVGYIYQNGLRGAVETWMLEYPTSASDEAVDAASEEFARSRGFERRVPRNGGGYYWTRTDDDGEWLLKISVDNSGPERSALIYYSLERKDEGWYERVRRRIVPGSEPRARAV